MEMTLKSVVLERTSVHAWWWVAAGEPGELGDAAVLSDAVGPPGFAEPDEPFWFAIVPAEVLGGGQPGSHGHAGLCGVTR